MTDHQRKTMENIRALSGDKKLVLHVGCGELKAEKLHQRYRDDTWFELRCDINPAVTPHILADMKSLPMLAGDSVDAIWNSHTIEHLYAHEVPIALKEWARVIKPGGHILMTLPDIESVAVEIAKGNLEDTLYMSPAGPIMALDVVYGYGQDIAKGNTYMAHRTGFTAHTLGLKLVAAGFTKVAVKATGFDLWAEGTKPQPGEEVSPNIQITRDKQPPAAAAAPATPPKHPGALWKGKRADELDVLPQEIK